MTPTPTTVFLAPVQDATIWENAASIASGNGGNLWVGVNGRGQARRALLKFDLASSLPDSAVVTQVTLTISLNKAEHDTDDALSVHKLLADWGEGTSNASGNGAGATAQTGDVTWNWRFFNTQAWAPGEQGGQFEHQASAETAVELGLDGSSPRPVSWSGNALIEDIEAWLADPSSNHGWIVIGSEDTNRQVGRYSSRESDAPPTLAITYLVIPPPIAE